MEKGVFSLYTIHAAYERMEAEIVALGREIERETRLSETEAALAKPNGAPLVGKPGAEAGDYRREAGSRTAGARASADYQAAMLTALRTNFRKVENVLEEGNDANGGYLAGFLVKDSHNKTARRAQ